MATDPGSFWNEPRYKMAVSGGGVVLFVLLLFTTFTHELTVPRKPSRPKVSVASAERFSESVDRTPAIWRNYLERDAQKYGVDAPDPDSMKEPFRYRADDKGWLLVPGKDGNSVEVAGLRLTVSKRDMRGSNKKLMVLSIENTTDVALAYKIDTRPSRGTQACQQKEDLTHNAMAVAAGDAELRSECIFRRGWKLKIKKVETVELPPVSYHYVSRLAASQVGYERRVVRGHKPPRGATCQLVLPAILAKGIESGEIPWRDVVDFYARHRCETYTFPDSYKAIQRAGEVELPAAGARR
jgi:hypothetical protein